MRDRSGLDRRAIPGHPVQRSCGHRGLKGLGRGSPPETFEPSTLTFAAARRLQVVVVEDPLDRQTSEDYSAA
jgi:hypothetical protein